MFADDGTSVSFGSTASGCLLRGASLPVEGAGYEVPGPWRGRATRFATFEVIEWLTGAYRRVEESIPGSTGWVGDLSGKGGGLGSASGRHRSHQSGRDLDLFFYAMDREGRPVRPGPGMLHYGPDGRAVAWSPPERGLRIEEPLPPAQLDVRRTWALVRALLTDPVVQVQWIFIDEPLALLLLKEASFEREEPALIARASILLHHPTDAQVHDDHMHVRVFCDVNDRGRGCVDHGPQHWWKKRWKYMGRQSVSGDVVATP